MSMNGMLKRLEIVAQHLQSDEPPTWCFFVQERFQAAANYGNQPPDVVLEDIEAVERMITAYDDLRREYHLDLIDTAILIARNAFPSHNQSASGIAGMIVGAYWEWDRERYGETKAWGTQQSRTRFESQVAGRLTDLAAPVDKASF